jgi:hypothetical protein
MKSVFTSPTTVNVEKNTAALTTIYTAVATDDNIVAYTLKSGFQKEKFTIYIIVNAAVFFSTLTVVGLVNTDFIESMVIDESSLTLVILKVLPAASSFSI